MWDSDSREVVRIFFVQLYEITARCQIWLRMLRLHWSNSISRYATASIRHWHFADLLPLAILHIWQITISLYLLSYSYISVCFRRFCLLYITRLFQLKRQRPTPPLTHESEAVYGHCSIFEFYTNYAGTDLTRLYLCEPFLLLNRYSFEVLRNSSTPRQGLR